jgi:hypothetical protein
MKKFTQTCSWISEAHKVYTISYSGRGPEGFLLNLKESRFPFVIVFHLLFPIQSLPNAFGKLTGSKMNVQASAQSTKEELRKKFCAGAL